MNSEAVLRKIFTLPSVFWPRYAEKQPKKSYKRS